MITTLKVLKSQLSMLLFKPHCGYISGRYVIGFLKSGEVFIWHKDQDILKSIHGLESIVSEEDFIHGKI